MIPLETTETIGFKHCQGRGSAQIDRDRFWRRCGVSLSRPVEPSNCVNIEQGVLSVADADNAVSYGPGLCWGVLAAGFATVAVACLMNTQLTSMWAGENLWTSQLVIGAGLSVTFVAMVGSIVQQAVNSGALSRPFDVLTYSAFIHSIRLFGGELGTAFMQHFIAVREKFHSNLIGLHVEAGNWLTDECLQLLTGGVSANSTGLDEAQGRSVALLAGQIRQQAYTLAYMDGFMIIAWVCVGIIVLVACLKPMKIFFDSQSQLPPGG